MSRERPRLLFLINSLNPGGAERQLLELVRSLDRDHFEVQVVVTYDQTDESKAGFYREMSAIPGVTLLSLHKRRGPLGYGSSLLRLHRLVQRFDPHILHGYMEGNLPVLLIGSLSRKRVVWGIRRTSADLSKMDRISRILQEVMVYLSPFTDLVIFNSEAGLRNHAQFGMRAPRMGVVPNGFDVETFRPDPGAGAQRREAWGIPGEVPLVGIVGRLDPVKDHPTFLRAAARIATKWPTARFVCVGNAPEPYARTLRDLAGSLGIGERVHWPGVCQDMKSAYNALSLLILASTDEGFPNVLGEAMACGVPCVTTRAGDAEALVGDTGLVVDMGDPGALAEAASILLAESAPLKAARAAAARARVCSVYSTEALARNTENLLASLL
ncbi:glycosyltransferase [Geothrix sp. 21YS21S-2]|uniref:glycosyltransferase n=1 Tax=Geothrix sp. 21YS21S-2 TaxID=3068893 RepID=UPI0027B95E06|nr:glycosyltransferase [Geothrix sp. 21YS21S-2]